ncbi:glycosyltransferase [Agrococcus lahaulensis]|uniref:glycosyltransferase n=1 Tax=Agrococcus lahaulensis TaxID=341722 RepID=UPI0012EC52F0|nr:glycosyltransferase [Agrococcus lahaulensis]
MTTHNGAAYVGEQTRSILDQEDVQVRLIVSDDASADDTPALLADIAADDRVVLLPPDRFGSPQANFLRLIRDADVTGASAVALADQDDIWALDKLARQVKQLERLGVDAVSSNVTAFWETGDSRRTKLIDKAQPQVEFDFLLESAGPGCTFVLSTDAFLRVRAALEHVVDDGAVPHDWLIYAIVRATGGRWHIDPRSTLQYRQHGGNATGANAGLQQARARLRQLASGEYRARCAAVARLCVALAPPELRLSLERLAPLFDSERLGSRMALWRLAPKLRRDPAERRFFRALLLLGIW